MKHDKRNMTFSDKVRKFLGLEDDSSYQSLPHGFRKCSRDIFIPEISMGDAIINPIHHTGWGRTINEGSIIESLTVKYKPSSPNTISPRRMTDGSGGYDLFYCDLETLTIKPGETKSIYSRFSMEIPTEFEAVIYSRSGMAINDKVVISYPTPLLDSDHRGEFIIPLSNMSNKPYVIHYGDSIAQLALHRRYTLDFIPVKELSKTKRGANGLGSTSKKQEEDNMGFLKDLLHGKRKGLKELEELHDDCGCPDCTGCTDENCGINDTYSYGGSFAIFNPGEEREKSGPEIRPRAASYEDASKFKVDGQKIKASEIEWNDDDVLSKTLAKVEDHVIHEIHDKTAEYYGLSHKYPYTLTADEINELTKKMLIDQIEAATTNDELDEIEKTVKEFNESGSRILLTEEEFVHYSSHLSTNIRKLPYRR